MRFFVFAIFYLLFSSATVLGQGYLWPSASGNYLSSTFGETRSAHFHAGLDIKTWGREGYKVFASRDGILYRLLVTERGYGNAIYLKHPDGKFTVYAHLQRFNDRFQEIADSIRLKDYAFEMDAVLDTLSIPVQQGDVIGYSGSSGIGPPHLHFEVRDSLDSAINALKTNLSVKDEKPPVFSSLIIEPLSRNSRINGKPTSHFVRVQESAGEYNFGEIKLHGKAGLAVNVYDQANDVYNAYAVYSLTLLHQADTLFYEELNRFNYNESNAMFLDRIAPFGSAKRGHQRLYKKEGIDIPFYLITKESAKIEPGDSSETFTIVASDYFGNTSKAKVTFIRNDEIDSSNPNLNNDTDRWYWTENWASPDLENTLDLTRTDFGFPWDNSQIVQLDSARKLQLSRITPEESMKVTTPDRRLVLRFGQHAFFDTLSIATFYSTESGDIRISIQPEMLPSKSGFGLEFFMGNNFEQDNNYRLFRIDPKDGEADYVESKMVGRTIHARPSGLGEFTIKADNQPPEISSFRVYKTDYGKWLASVKVKDELTGIESSSAKFVINDQQGIAEYDYEEDLLIFYLPNFTPDSENTAIIEIEDKAGNRASKIFKD